MGKDLDNVQMLHLLHNEEFVFHIIHTRVLPVGAKFTEFAGYFDVLLVASKKDYTETTCVQLFRLNGIELKVKEKDNQKGAPSLQV